MCLWFNITENNWNMEKKVVRIEMTVYTDNFRDRDTERDLDRVLVPLRNIESGQTRIEEVRINDIR